MIKRTDWSTRFISRATFVLGPTRRSADSNSITFWSCSRHAASCLLIGVLVNSKPGLLHPASEPKYLFRSNLLSLCWQLLLNPLESCNENLPKKSTLRKYALSTLQCRGVVLPRTARARAVALRHRRGDRSCRCDRNSGPRPH